MLSLLGRPSQAPQTLLRVRQGFARRNIFSINEKRLYLNGESSPVPWIWLRDACQCKVCVHPSTRQKLHRSSDIPLDISPQNIKLSKTDLLVNWSDHESAYPLDWLYKYASDDQLNAYYRPVKAGERSIYWTAEVLKSSPTLWLDYSTLTKQKHLQQAFNQLLLYGILFVKGVDTTNKDNDRCELQKLANIFGRIRDTFYGPLWDVKSVPQSLNIAYTNLNLDLHMDLLYVKCVILCRPSSLI